ncbi:hypothetical protein RsoM2USA_279 [Ralstonia phage RsoM2USA]|nr:hypothetical protein RsoM2USA_279 [Ralstonia phage RsoM2USA]
MSFKQWLKEDSEDYELLKWTLDHLVLSTNIDSGTTQAIQKKDYGHLVRNGKLVGLEHMTIRVNARNFPNRTVTFPVKMGQAIGMQLEDCYLEGFQNYPKLEHLVLIDCNVRKGFAEWVTKDVGKWVLRGTLISYADFELMLASGKEFNYSPGSITVMYVNDKYKISHSANAIDSSKSTNPHNVTHIAFDDPFELQDYLLSHDLISKGFKP